jgi:hypothetical protein
VQNTPLIEMRLNTSDNGSIPAFQGSGVSVMFPGGLVIDSRPLADLLIAASADRSIASALWRQEMENECDRENL